MSNASNAVQYVLSKGSVIVITPEEEKVYPSNSDDYSVIKKFILDGDEPGLSEYINSLKKTVENLYEGFTVENEVIFVDGEALPELLGRRLKAFADEGADYKYLLRFWENLKKNPSYQSVNNLFDFMERVHCPISSDGLIQCYKVVRNDFLDKYTGTILNKPGTTVSVPRNTVDDNRNNHCSAGIHCGGLSYIHWYGNKESGDRIIRILLNPKDVVSVPTDHNFMKVRVCEYLVAEEVSWDEAQPTNETYQYDDSNDDDDIDDIEEDWYDEDDENEWEDEDDWVDEDEEDEGY